MSGQRYAVDWDDQHFPAIVRAEDHPYGGDYQQLTLIEARAEIVEHFQHIIEHARDQISTARAVRASDLTR